jgi:hypothetical protein
MHVRVTGALSATLLTLVSHAQAQSTSTKSDQPGTLRPSIIQTELGQPQPAPKHCTYNDMVACEGECRRYAPETPHGFMVDPECRMDCLERCGGTTIDR